MVTFLYLCGILSFAWSLLSFAGGGTVMTQIYSGTIATAGAVFIVGGAIVEALRKHAGTVIAEVRRASANERWQNIETCVQYLAAARKKEERSEQGQAE